MTFFPLKYNIMLEYAFERAFSQNYAKILEVVNLAINKFHAQCALMAYSYT